MTKIIVNPIDFSKPGSYRKRRIVFAAMHAVAAAADSAGRDEKKTAAAGLAAIEAFLELDDILVEQLETDDGSDLQAALDELSADQFDDLLGGVLGSPVPTESAAD